MNHQNHTVPAKACSPDADRAGPDAPGRQPEWLVHILALLVFLLRKHLPGYGMGLLLPSWWHDRPDLPLGSVQALAASIRGNYGNQIAWTCRRRGIGPGHPDWPEISRAIVAFGGSLKGFRAGLPPCGLQWWENPHLGTGMSGERHTDPGRRRNRAAAVTTDCRGRSAAVSDRCACRTRACGVACASAADPCPCGDRSPEGSAVCLGLPILSCLNDRGRSMASPAVLIRAVAAPSGIAWRGAALQRQEPEQQQQRLLPPIRPVRRVAAQVKTPDDADAPWGR